MAEETEVEPVAPEAVPPVVEVSPEVAALRGKLAQVQAKNAAEAAAREEMAARLHAFEGIDPETVGKMREAYAATQSADERAESMRKQMEANAKKKSDDFAAERTAWDESRQKARGRLDSAVMKDRVMAAVEAKKLTLQPGARASLLMHAEHTFKVEDDMETLTPRDVVLDGDNNEIDVNSWVDRLVGSHSYLFEGGGGGGARNGAPGGAKTQYVMSALTPGQRSKAIEEVKAGTAEWKE